MKTTGAQINNGKFFTHVNILAILNNRIIRNETQKETLLKQKG